ncbi:MAG: phage major tail protein, TP901-1 family [Pseudomonadota bacterium]
MAAQKGKDFLLKLDSNGSGSFITVAGIRSRSLSFNATPVDITNADSAGRWRELLAGAGARRASLTGSGVFKDASSDAHVRQIFFDGDIRTWQIIIPGFGTLAGLFQITALDYSAESNAEVRFDIALESAGEITFLAA